MKKTLSSLLCAALSLTLLVVACGDSVPEVPLPLADGGVLWSDCDATRAGGGCAAGESCRFVEHYGRSICVPTCGPQALCAPSQAACCAGGGDGGAGGYCLPREVCEALDAGADAGSVDAGADGGPVDGTDAGGSKDAGAGTDAGTDAGTRADAGTDAGTGLDAGTRTDAGTDAGTGLDAGTRTDAGIDAGTVIDAGTDAGPTTGHTDIRIMASNLTSGNGQDYDPGHGIRLMQGVKPDVILIQEFNYRTNSATDIRALVEQIGPGFHYYREGGAQIPNGIISRWPIVESGEWDDPRVTNRDFAYARIDIPGPRDLWAVSVHLLTSSSSERNLEATSLANYIKANIPPGDYLTVGGDFNTKSYNESCFSQLAQVVTTAGPYPVDRNNNSYTSADRDDPYDHVLVDSDLRQHQQATVIRGPSSSSTFPNGLVLDSRVYTPLSEISPALFGDSGASMMQHMGVVKDFRVPNF